jgi:ABC-type lipoprotein release transport system permease subunit
MTNRMSIGSRAPNGADSIDFMVFGAVSFVFLLDAMLACTFPAHRAGRVDPLGALRQE